MKSSQVLRLLGVTRQTLTSYVKQGIIQVTKLDNGYYDYHEDSVMKFLKKDNRVNMIYARVSTYKQKNDLNNQIGELVTYCDDNNVKYDKIIKDIDSGINFDRKGFSELIDMVIHHKISNIYITYKDRISRLSFITLENMFKQFGTSIIVINDTEKIDEEELFDELNATIQFYSSKINSKKGKQIMTNINETLTK